MVTKLETFKGNFSVVCKFWIVEDDFEWAFCWGVWTQIIRISFCFLLELIQMMYLWELPWCSCREF